MSWTLAAPARAQEAPPTPQPADAATLDALCEQLAALQRAAPEAWNAAHAASGRPADLGLLDDALFECQRGRYGVWGFVLGAPDLEAEPDPDEPEDFHFPHGGDWHAVYLDAHGTERRSAPTSYYLADHFGFDDIDVFDFDGDGRDELVFEYSYWADGPARRLEILTAGQDDVGDYRPATRLAPRAVDDIDQDGRPDLYATVWHIDSQFSMDDDGVTKTLPAISLPDGTFSFEHPAAARVALERCPRRPTHFLLHDRAGIAPEALERLQEEFDAEDGDAEYFFRQVACARLHGATREELAPLRDVMCEPPDEDGEEDDSALCALEDELDAWLAVEPPVRLDRVTKP